MKIDLEETYKKIKSDKRRIYDEEVHCPLLLKVLTDRTMGTMASFCTEAVIGETTFWQWLRTHELFAEVYAYCRMFMRRRWERDGARIRNKLYAPGVVSHEFEYWKQIGWSMFGISKNSRIKLDLNPKDSPDQHYIQLLEQAGKGDFTAAEIKQLMEAINVGLKAHDVVQLQKEIDQLKADLAIMKGNQNNVENSFSDTRIT